MRRRTPLAVVLLLGAVSGCPNLQDETPPPAPPPKEVLDFGVYWPPQDPADPAGPVGKAFLLGKLYLRDAEQGSLTLTIDLTRPHAEEDRETWNSRLAYREYDWMERLRVWDVDENWL